MAGDPVTERGSRESVAARSAALRDTDLLDRVRSWANDRSEQFPDDAFALELKESPNDRDPRSIQVTLSGGSKIGELVVWGNGMAELSCGDFESGVVTPEHRDIDSEADLDRAISDLLCWMTA